MKISDIIIEYKDTTQDDHKTPQRQGYDCGVATTVSILKFHNKDIQSYIDVQDKLKTNKNTGTSPDKIKETLKKYNLKVQDGTLNPGEIGIMLVNIETFYNGKDAKLKDDQNGHWVLYKSNNENGTSDDITIYDGWKDKDRLISKKDISKYTKSIKIKNTTYNDVIFKVAK